MKSLETTAHGIRYLQTYMEAGFPRVCANTRENKKKLIVTEMQRLYAQGVDVSKIAKTVGVNSVTAFKWLREAGTHTPKKLKHKEKTGRFAHIK